MNTPVYGSSLREAGAALHTLKVQASIIPDMYLRITEGSAFINRKLVEYAGGRIGPLVVPTVNSYIVVIALRGNTPVILYGNPVANNPEFPELPTDALPLAAIILRSSDTMISQDMVQDIRPIFSATTYIESHNDLIDKDFADQHPISAITGLQAALDAKFDAKDMSAELDTKANYNGTRSAKFTFNSESAGVPTSDIVLEFKRGAQPSAAIRFNEEEDRLEFTDNGDEWHPFNTTLELDPFNEENYYTKTQVDAKVREVNTAVLTKADSARVNRIEEQLTDVAKMSDVNNMFLNLYSKQDLDRIVKDMKLGLATINNKANSEDVYTKEEVNAIHAQIDSDTQVAFADVNTRIDKVTDTVNNVVVPRLDAITDDVTDKINTAQDTFDEKTTAAVNEVKDIEQTLNDKVDTGLANVEKRISDAAAVSIAMVSEKTGQLDAKFDIAIREASEKYDSIKEDFDTTKENITTKVDELESKITGFDTAIQTNSDAITTINDTIADDEARLENLTISVEKAQADIETIQDANENFDARINDVENALDNHKQTAEQVLNETVETINTTINERAADLDQKIINTNTELENAKEEINNTIDAKTEELNTSISNLNNTLSEKDNEIITSIEELKTDINNREAVLNTTISDNKTALEASINEAKTELTTAINNAKDELTTNYQAADQDISDDVAAKVSAINAALELKADKENYVSKTELDEAIQNVDITDTVYTKEEMDNLLGSKAEIRDVYQYTQAQIDNTLANKQEALGYTPEDTAKKNIANGYAGLDANGKVSINQLPDAARQKTNVVTDEAARLAITGMVEGDRAFETATGNSYIYDGANWILTAAANWENVNIDFSNIIGTPTDLTGYGITDAVTETELTNKLANKADKDHGHDVSEITVTDERMFISAAKLNEIDAKANTADVYSKALADETFATKTEVNTKFNDYSTSAEVIQEIGNTVDTKLTDYYNKTDANSLLNDKLDKTDVTVAKVDDVNTAINDAKTELQTAIDAKADVADVYTKDEVYTKTETDDAIDTSIDSVLQSVNTAINEALGINNSSGSNDSLVDTINATKNLIKQLSEDKDTKINEVRTQIIEQVVTRESIVEIVKTETNVDLEDLTTTNDVDDKIEVAKTEIQNQIDDVLTDMEDKVDASEFISLTNDVTNLENKVTDVTTKTNDTADLLDTYVPIIEAKTTMAEVDSKLANYTTTNDLAEMLDEKVTQADINSALAAYTNTEDLTGLLAEKATQADINTAVANYTTTEDLNTALDAKADKTNLIGSNGEIDNKVMTNKAGYTGSYTRLWNEFNSGGGSLVYNASDNTLSYVGVNLSSAGDLVQVQMYAKHKDSNIGTRVNINTDKGMFYLKGTTNLGFPEEREVAVLADITALKNELEAKIEEYKALIDDVDVSDINSKIADLTSRVEVLEGM